MTKQRKIIQRKRTLNTAAWDIQNRLGFGDLSAADFSALNNYTLYPIRAISAIRRVVRGSTLAQSYLRAIRSNVVGRGAQPTFSTVENKSDRERIKDLWERWSEEPTVNGANTNWGAVCRSIIGSMAQDGRVFTLFRHHRDYAFGFGIMPVERDWFAECPSAGKRHVEIEKGREYDVTNGVARRESGRVAGYMFFEGGESPQSVEASAVFGGSEIRSREVFIPANMVCDFKMQETVGNLSGFPTAMLPFIASIQDLSNLDKSVAAAMLAASYKMGFFEKTEEATPGGGSGAPNPGIEQEDDDYVPMTRMEQLTVEELPRGWSFRGYDPTVPSADLKNYRDTLIRSAAASLGIDSSTLSGNVADVNFSSLRHATLNARQNYRITQHEAQGFLYRPTLRRLLEFTEYTGTLKLSAAKSLRQAIATEWRHPAWQWIDPLKDIMAHQGEVALGTNSPQRICAENGVDHNQIIMEIAEAKKAIEAAGLTVDELSAIAGLFKGADSAAANEPNPDDTNNGGGANK